jgi:hypothetical protein
MYGKSETKRSTRGDCIPFELLRPGEGQILTIVHQILSKV